LTENRTNALEAISSEENPLRARALWVLLAAGAAAGATTAALLLQGSEEGPPSLSMSRP
jgi:hypothetical protein